MIVKKEDKARIIEEIGEGLGKSRTLFLIDFKKMNVSQSVELRKLLTRNNFTYRVVKNRLALRALAESAPAEIKDHFQGPTAIASTVDNPLDLARIIKDFSNHGKLLAVKCGIVEGTYLPEDRFEEICLISSRDELLAKIRFMISYQLSRFLRTLQAPLTDLGNLLVQLKDRKKD